MVAPVRGARARPPAPVAPVGLYPGDQVSLRQSPDLAAAARRSLEVRLEDGAGAPGWSAAWAAALAARLEDADLAHSLLVRLVTARAAPNLLNGGREEYQIDANLGGAAAIVEMLLQCHEVGVVTVLPALPASWPDGHANGLRARGGLEVALHWRACRLESATLLPRRAARLLVRSPRAHLRAVRGPDGDIFTASPGADGWVVSMDATGPYALHFD